MSHVVLKKSLAKQLMESSMHDVSDEHMQKLGLGGIVSSILGGGGAQKANYKPAPIIKQDFLPQIKLLQGQQADVYGNQKSLAQTLLDQSNGIGPNPAQAQLAQNTGTNVANQAALMAGQRGAAANPGAIARMVGQQGAAIQQNAVGQAATLEAQQRLEAQKELEQQYSNMANQSIQGENIQQTGQAAQNSAITGATNAANQLNASANAANSSAGNALLGSLLQAGGAIAGGMIGGPPGAMAGGALAGTMAGGGGSAGGANNAPQSPYSSGDELSIPAAHGGEIPKKSFSRALLDNGGQVPGGAPKHRYDTVENDTQKTLLTPEEVVLPLSVTLAEDAPQKAAEFMKHIQDEKKGKTGKSREYGNVIEARKSLKDRVEHLEKLCMGGYAKGA